uniref:Uncharacterized protein n=1 Tax=Oxyrrhis marina TaxID=2969 RepID=A0A7S3UI64_OXYMA
MAEGVVEVKAYARVEPVNAPLIVVNMVFMDAVERPMDYDLAAKSVRVLVRNDDLQIAKRRWVTPHFDISQNVVVTTNEGETPSENWIKVTFENLEKSAWEGFISVTARKRDSTLRESAAPREKASYNGRKTCDDPPLKNAALLFVVTLLVFLLLIFLR